MREQLDCLWMFCFSFKNAFYNIMSIKIFFLGVFSSLYFLGIAPAKAQFSRPISIGIGVGTPRGATDLSASGSNFSFYGEVDFLLTPFITIGAHGQKGTFSGKRGDSRFENNYYAADLNLKVRLGQFMANSKDYSRFVLQSSMLQRIVANAYIGAGGGLIKNRISRTIASDYAEEVKKVAGELSKNLGEISIIVPINAGVDIPIGGSFYGPKWAVNVNYQYTLSIGDNLDGVKLGKNDRYSVLSLGVKYALGATK